jgi:hypothetical protein
VVTLDYTWLVQPLAWRPVPPINSMSVARPDSSPAYVVNTASRDEYGVFDPGSVTLETALDADPLALATYTTTYQAAFRQRPPLLTFDLLDRAETEQWLILSVGEGTRIILANLPATWPAECLSLFVDGINHEISLDYAQGRVHLLAAGRAGRRAGRAVVCRGPLGGRRHRRRPVLGTRWRLHPDRAVQAHLRHRHHHHRHRRHGQLSDLRMAQVGRGVMLVDYAFKPWPSTAALKAAGASGVSRYLSYVNSRTAPKIVTKAEYDALLAAGLAVVLNWEYDTHDFTNAGFDARLAANEALRQARALGYPDVCPIYFSVDFDATAGQWSTIAARFRAVNAVLGVARTGIYGPWDVLEWARRDGVAAWFWQAGMSTSWSAGRNRNLWPGAHLRQRRTATIGGADCDINDIIQADYGQVGGDDAVGINELRIQRRQRTHGRYAWAWTARCTPATTRARWPMRAIRCGTCCGGWTPTSPPTLPRTRRPPWR